MFSSTQNQMYPSARETATCAHNAVRPMVYRPSPKQKPINVPQGMLKTPMKKCLRRENSKLEYTGWYFKE
jgi:hypothetical protein